MKTKKLQHIGLSLLTAGAALLSVTPSVHAADKKPNILVIWGDDIGTWNISHNNRGMMGYQTPNIDRIAKEGVAFTDYYAQQSCTAGRAAYARGRNFVVSPLPGPGYEQMAGGFKVEFVSPRELRLALSAP